MKKERIKGVTVIKISILWVFVLAIILALIIAFFKNSIFASSIEFEEETLNVEKNENEVDILNLMLENNFVNKKLVNEERKIDFEIEKTDDDQVPKGEEVIVVKGKKGKKQVTALQSYGENTYFKEEIIETEIKKEPKTQIVHVGTSKFLAKYKVHIGEDMYLLEKADLKKEPKEDSETITTVGRYLNLELVKVSDKWTKVKYKEDEGYLPNDKLTSDKVNPKIVELNRIATLQESLSLSMNLAEPSGLTLSDYISVLGYNERDRNGIFAQNAEIFYNAEQKYGVNGIFLAAIGIHESAWGTSYLATTKNNLFGYKAYDRDPINSAQDFESYEECINTVAEALSKNYLTPEGSYYNGTTIQSVNTKYASDPDWYNGVYSYMEYLYDKLG